MNTLVEAGIEQERACQQRLGSILSHTAVVDSQRRRIAVHQANGILQVEQNLPPGRFGRDGCQLLFPRVVDDHGNRAEDGRQLRIVERSQEQCLAMGMVGIAALDISRQVLELGNRVVDVANGLVIDVPYIVFGVTNRRQQVGPLKLIVLTAAASQHFIAGNAGDHIQKGERLVCSSKQALVDTRFLGFQQYFGIAVTVMET